MHTNFSLKFKKLDIVVIVLAILISTIFLVSMLFVNNTFSSSDKYVVVSIKNQEITSLRTDLNSLTEEKEITLKKEDYPTLLADFYITLNKDKGVKVHNITCNDHTCEKQGWVNVPGMSIVCLYNQVKIEVVSSKGGEIIIGGRVL